MTLEAYLPILIFTALITVFGVASLIVSHLMAPKMPTPAKLAPYECGITPADADEARVQRFPVKFYVVAMLFIVFDVEVMFLFPWAVISKDLGLAGLAAMGLFLAILTGAYVYDWMRGGLEWD